MVIGLYEYPHKSPIRSIYVSIQTHRNTSNPRTWVTYFVTRVPTTEGSEPEATHPTKLYRSRLHYHYMVGLCMGGRESLKGRN